MGRLRRDNHAAMSNGSRSRGHARPPIFAIGMKVFLDDERTTLEGWVRVYWPAEAIALLESGQVDELSLDHDWATMCVVPTMT